MSSRMPASAWRVDPDDPRAPPEEIWNALSPAERKRVVDSLPSEFTLPEALPPEGDPHFNAKVGAREVLGGFFARAGRRVYLACEMATYYPGEPVFAPDVFAVLDVPLHERMSWVVQEEGKGLDLALEIFVAGNRRKDHEKNVERYARLGIAEYFIFDRGRLRLHGYRLPEPGARVYQPIVPQGGRYASRVLGLDLCLDETRLRFFNGTAAVLDAGELITSLEKMVGDRELRLTAAEDRAYAAEEQASAAEEHARAAEERAEEIERRLAEALAEIERLKADRSKS